MKPTSRMFSLTVEDFQKQKIQVASVAFLFLIRKQ
jgi:hypothetical protein